MKLIAKLEHFHHEVLN
jgi:hypothetical protein